MSVCAPQIDHVVIPPRSLEQTLATANLTDYLTLLRESGMLTQLSGMSGVTLFAPIQGTLNQLRNLTTKERLQGEQQQTTTQQNQTAQTQPMQRMRRLLQTQPIQTQPVQQPVQQTQPVQQQQQPTQSTQQQQQPILQQPMQSANLSSPESDLRIPQSVLQQIVKSTVVPGVYYSPSFNFTSALKSLSGETLQLSNATQVPIGFEEKGQEGARTTPLWQVGVGQPVQQKPQPIQSANATANATSPANATASGNATATFRVFQAEQTASPSNATVSSGNATNLGGLEWSNSSILYQDLLSASHTPQTHANS